MANEKPRFGELTIMNLPDDGLVFNARGVGPKDFIELRNADYGKGFRMPTMPELVPLIHASLENKRYETAKNVVKTLRRRQLTGNTIVYHFPKGMFVEDLPKIKSDRIITPTFKVLEKRLGSHEERKVVFSNDKSIRFTPYNFKKGNQTSLKLSTNTGIIALTGSEENAEKFAKASEHYIGKPYFWALSDVNLPETRVIDLYTDNLGIPFSLCIKTKFFDYSDRYTSFGVFGISDARTIASQNTVKTLKGILSECKK